jgi:hypothetical protein
MSVNYLNLHKAWCFIRLYLLCHVWICTLDKCKHKYIQCMSLLHFIYSVYEFASVYIQCMSLPCFTLYIQCMSLLQFYIQCMSLLQCMRLVCYLPYLYCLILSEPVCLLLSVLLEADHSLWTDNYLHAWTLWPCLVNWISNLDATWAVECCDIPPLNKNG